jgi:hypothetical protein
MTKYNNGKIYKIEPVCDHVEHEIYIGSTTRTYLCERMTHHRYDYKKWKDGQTRKSTLYDLFDKFGLEQCKIILLENVNCESLDQLHAKEADHIKSNNCINKVIPGRTIKEYRNDNKDILADKRKAYVSKNKDCLNEKRKIYRENNIEYIKAREKQYKDAHKEQSKEYYNDKKDYLHEKIQCNCGLFSSRQHIARHEKSKKHIKLIESLNNSKDNVEIFS